MTVQQSERNVDSDIEPPATAPQVIAAVAKDDQDVAPQLPARRNPSVRSNTSRPVLASANDTSSVSIPTTESPLPVGWEHAFDQDGTIYYFNESTGESRWDKPEEPEKDEPPPLPQRDDSADTFIQGLNPNELQKLVYIYIYDREEKRPKC
ncbi:hypothetical protein PS15m_009677 [Mucor circinelloides]